MRALPLLLLLTACADPAPPNADGPAYGDSPAATALPATPEAPDLRPDGPLTPAAPAEAVEAFPAPVGPHGDACARRGDVDVCRRRQASGAAEVVIERAGRRIAGWPVGAGAQAGAFAAFAADLDRDGDQDHVVAVLTAVSNGRAVHTWTVHVVPGGHAAPAYAFEVEDFGAGGQSFAQHRGRDVIWATEWTNAPDPSGSRGEGLYLLGRPMTLTSGGLVPATGLPLRARRLLSGFDPGSEEGAAGWLGAGGENVQADLARAGCTSRARRVTVDEAREGEDRYRNAALFVASGEAEWAYGAGPASGGSISHLGDAASGRLFPPAYRPPRLAERLTGQALRLTECASGDWTRTRVLWL